MYHDNVRDAVIVGGGNAGIAAAACLKRVGISASVLERGDRVGMSWHDRYDSLRLNSWRPLSGQPYMRIPSSLGPWPSKTAYRDFLDDFTRSEGLDVRCGCKVERIWHQDGLWHVTVNGIDTTYPNVVIATGRWRVPVIPNWPGCEHFAGSLMHSSEYRNAKDFQNCDVLVVGGGNSALEIATDLASTSASITVSIRRPPALFPQSFLGLNAHLLVFLTSRLPARLMDIALWTSSYVLYHDLIRIGFAPGPRRAITSLKTTGQLPPVDRGISDALRSGLIAVAPAIRSLSETGVHFTDGSHRRYNVIIAATGYRTGLSDFLEAPGVLDADQIPRSHAPDAAAPGLFFIGFRPGVTGQMRESARDARQLARVWNRSAVVR